MKNLKPGHSRCLCPTCSESFNSVFAFDKHRVAVDPKNPDKKRRCLSAQEMSQMGMVENAQGYWITEAMNGKTQSKMKILDKEK